LAVGKTDRPKRFVEAAGERARGALRVQAQARIAHHMRDGKREIRIG
jgi:hypothetical protein